MNIQSVNSDIQLLEKALKLVEKTENYLHFNKSVLIKELCEQIFTLQDKAEKQTTFINSLK